MATVAQQISVPTLPPVTYVEPVDGSRAIMKLQLLADLLRQEDSAEANPGVLNPAVSSPLEAEYLSRQDLGTSLASRGPGVSATISATLAQLLDEPLIHPALTKQNAAFSTPHLPLTTLRTGLLSPSPEKDSPVPALDLELGLVRDTAQPQARGTATETGCSDGAHLSDKSAKKTGAGIEGEGGEPADDEADMLRALLSAVANEGQVQGGARRSAAVAHVPPPVRPSATLPLSPGPSLSGPSLSVLDLYGAGKGSSPVSGTRPAIGPALGMGMDDSLLGQRGQALLAPSRRPPHTPVHGDGHTSPPPHPHSNRTVRFVGVGEVFGGHGGRVRVNRHGEGGGDGAGGGGSRPRRCAPAAPRDPLSVAQVLPSPLSPSSLDGPIGFSVSPPSSRSPSASGGKQGTRLRTVSPRRAAARSGSPSTAGRPLGAALTETGQSVLSRIGGAIESADARLTGMAQAVAALDGRRGEGEEALCRTARAQSNPRLPLPAPTMVRGSTYHLMYERDDESEEEGEGGGGGADLLHGDHEALQRLLSAAGLSLGMPHGQVSSASTGGKHMWRYLLDPPGQGEGAAPQPAPYTPARVRALWSPTPLPLPAGLTYDEGSLLPDPATQAVTYGWFPLTQGPGARPPFPSMDLATAAGNAGSAGLSSWLEQLALTSASARSDLRAVQASMGVGAGETEPSTLAIEAMGLSVEVLQSRLADASRELQDTARDGLHAVGADNIVTALQLRQDEAGEAGQTRTGRMLARLGGRRRDMALLTPALESRVQAKTSLVCDMEQGLARAGASLAKCRGVKGKLDEQQAALAREEAAILSGEADVSSQGWQDRLSEACELAEAAARAGVEAKYSALLKHVEDDTEAIIQAARVQAEKGAYEVAAEIEAQQGAEFDASMAVLRSRAAAEVGAGAAISARLDAAHAALTGSIELRALKGSCRRLWVTMSAESLAAALGVDEACVSGMRRSRAEEVGREQKGDNRGAHVQASVRRSKPAATRPSPLLALGLDMGHSARGRVGRGKELGEDGESVVSMSFSRVGYDLDDRSLTDEAPSPLWPKDMHSSVLAADALSRVRVEGMGKQALSQADRVRWLRDCLLSTYSPAIRSRIALSAWLADCIRATSYSPALTTLLAVATKVGVRQLAHVRAGRSVPPSLNLTLIVAQLQQEQAIVDLSTGQRSPSSPSGHMPLPFPLCAVLPDGPGRLPLPSRSPLGMRVGDIVPSLSPALPSSPTPSLARFPTLAALATSHPRLDDLLVQREGEDRTAAEPPALYPTREEVANASLLSSAISRSVVSSTLRTILPTLLHAEAGAAGLHARLALPTPPLTGQEEEVEGSVFGGRRGQARVEPLVF